MSELAFLSPGTARAEAGFVPRQASPLAGALEGARGIVDLSLLGKVELRDGILDALPAEAEPLPITPRRTLVLCPPESCAAVLAVPARLAVDMTGALAGIELADEALMRRLTDLDLEALPAAGKFAGVPAFVAPRFRIFFPQEYGRSVVEAVRDLREGLA